MICSDCLYFNPEYFMCILDDLPCNEKMTGCKWYGARKIEFKVSDYGKGIEYDLPPEGQLGERK